MSDLPPNNNDPEFVMWWDGHAPILTHPAFPLKEAVKAGWVAALAFHSQPFGFTQEDVVRLRELAGECTEQMESESLPPDPNSRRLWWREMGDACDSLADRIAALLPPETTT